MNNFNSERQAAKAELTLLHSELFIGQVTEDKYDDLIRSGNWAKKFQNI